MKALLITAGLAVVFGIIAVVWNVSLENQSARLRNQAKAQQDVCMTVRDTMFSTIRDTAQVKNEYAAELKDLVSAYVEGRSDGPGAGSLMKWVQENNPTLDKEIYTRLMTTIEAQRAKFQVAQKELRSVKEQHDNLVSTFPGSFFIDDLTKIEVVIVTSSGTRKVYETGIDDESPLDAGKKK